MKTLALSILIIFGLLLQGFATYAKPLEIGADTRTSMAQQLSGIADKQAFQTCCDEDEQEQRSSTPCNGDCKTIVSNYVFQFPTKISVHSSLQSVGEYTSQNVVQLRPPKA